MSHMVNGVPADDQVINRILRLTLRCTPPHRSRDQLSVIPWAKVLLKEQGWSPPSPAHNRPFYGNPHPELVFRSYVLSFSSHPTELPSPPLKVPKNQPDPLRRDGIPCSQPQQLIQVVSKPLQLPDHPVVRPTPDRAIQRDRPDEPGLRHPRTLSTPPDLVMLTWSTPYISPANPPPLPPRNLPDGKPLDLPRSFFQHLLKEP